MQDNDFSPLDTQHASDLSDSIALSRVPQQYKQMIVNASQARGVPIICWQTWLRWNLILILRQLLRRSARNDAINA